MPDPTETGRPGRASVLIVGYGPVGQLLSVLLAQYGHRVTVVERWPQAYAMPRAVAFDGESARILAAAGVGDHIKSFAEPSGDYSWLSADGRELIHYEAHETRGLSGWPDSTSMYQPGLEAALIARGAELPNLRVVRGRRAVDLTEFSDPSGPGVELVAEDDAGARSTFTADWVVGCDGANSFVRDRIGTDFTDLGFRHDWLICDVVPRPAREFRPNNLQICDPARPRTSVSAGPGHRRWEFMRVAGETVAELETPEAAWRLLEEFGVGPDNATLERYAVYTFEARHAHRWRAGRLLIAGDAAHLMPPFAAQGMSSGFRDAANLAWKLHLVLTGLADERLLDTYTEERRKHVEHAIDMSVSLGRVICQTDPEAARERDELMLAMRHRAPARAAQPSAVAQLTDGLLPDPAGAGSDALAGTLSPQARVVRGGEDGLFDSVAGTGFTLLAAKPVHELLDRTRLDVLRRLGVRAVRLLAAGTPAAAADGASVVDADDVYLPYLSQHGVVAALIRPDFYVFGAAADASRLAALVDDLRARLTG
ncbi:bifunctional 3-(3-hydroxy-phenyl)propionate/3-hydroxycinnamic acid hydroxylase [Streptomyces sp. MAR4 CNX-425]|uniref:bifunctional 3-(3-hydroxy-phenyl)propionate/3-hydroxycinnamic acid hydroxylase MhpA n=1 Tax=Streptomyces sp. MAR4 CNX-425 TaxID=3406343 RepID=UPI003B501414